MWSLAPNCLNCEIYKISRSKTAVGKNRFSFGRIESFCISSSKDRCINCPLSIHSCIINDTCEVRKRYNRMMGQIKDSCNFYMFQCQLMGAIMPCSIFISLSGEFHCVFYCVEHPALISSDLTLCIYFKLAYI